MGAIGRLAADGLRTATAMTKAMRSLKGDGEWCKHRNKWQKRRYWKRERRATEHDIKRQIEG